MFINIEKPRTRTSTAEPDGAYIRVMSAGVDRRGNRRLRLHITIGASAAKAINLTSPRHPMRLQIGTGEDAGKVAVMCDARGDFFANRTKSGTYRMDVASGALVGRISLSFAPLFIDQARVVPGAPSRPAMLILKCPAEMFASTTESNHDR